MSKQDLQTVLDFVKSVYDDKQPAWDHQSKPIVEILQRLIDAPESEPVAVRYHNPLIPKDEIIQRMQEQLNR